MADYTHLPTGAVVNEETRESWVLSGRSRGTDFLPYGTPDAAVSSDEIAGGDAAPVWDPHACACWIRKTDGVRMTPNAAANAVARGDCTPDDFDELPPEEAPPPAKPKVSRK